MCVFEEEGRCERMVSRQGQGQGQEGCKVDATNSGKA